MRDLEGRQEAVLEELGQSAEEFEQLDPVKQAVAVYAAFWKTEADRYLLLTRRIGLNGATYSNRLKRSARPAWLCSGAKRRRGAWMVGDGQNSMQIQFLGQRSESSKKGHTKRRQIRKSQRGG